MALDFTQKQLKAEFGNNCHVRYRFEAEKDRLVLVKGGRGSRLFRKAYPISVEGRDKSGRPVKVLSPPMQKIFGSFDGKTAIQRSPPRWVAEDHVEKAIDFLKKLK